LFFLKRYTEKKHGANCFLSFSSVFLTAVGSIIGIWIGFKLSKG